MKVFGLTFTLLCTLTLGCDSSKTEEKPTVPPNSQIEDLSSEEIQSQKDDFQQTEEHRHKLLTILEEHKELSPLFMDGDYAMIDANSTRIDFLGTKPDGDKHGGGFGHAEGRLLLTTELRLHSIEVKITTRSLWADVPALAAHLKNQDFFNVNEYPEITFNSTSVEDLGEGKYTVTGDLTMLETTNEISFPALIGVTHSESGGQGVTLTSKFEIDRLSFGMNYGEGKIDKDVKMTVTIGAPAGPSPGDVAAPKEKKTEAKEEKKEAATDDGAKSDEKDK